ncbi:MAG: hypothetical protein HYZ90_07330 [Candidatus Omnitrophica bacterium]|nr:hypothetical protein [Candidatus Omnitrophota bacterium]
MDRTLWYPAKVARNPDTLKAHAETLIELAGQLWAVSWVMEQLLNEGRDDWAYAFALHWLVLKEYELHMAHLLTPVQGAGYGGEVAQEVFSSFDRWGFSRRTDLIRHLKQMDSGETVQKPGRKLFQYLQEFYRENFLSDEERLQLLLGQVAGPATEPSAAGLEEEAQAQYPEDPDVARILKMIFLTVIKEGIDRVDFRFEQVGPEESVFVGDLFSGPEGRETLREDLGRIEVGSSREFYDNFLLRLKIMAEIEQTYPQHRATLSGIFSLDVRDRPVTIDLTIAGRGEEAELATLRFRYPEGLPTDEAAAGLEGQEIVGTLQWLPSAVGLQGKELQLRTQASFVPYEYTYVRPRDPTKFVKDLLKAEGEYRAEATATFYERSLWAKKRGETEWTKQRRPVWVEVHQDQIWFTEDDPPAADPSRWYALKGSDLLLIPRSGTIILFPFSLTHRKTEAVLRLEANTLRHKAVLRPSKDLLALHVPLGPAEKKARELIANFGKAYLRYDRYLWGHPDALGDANPAFQELERARDEIKKIDPSDQEIKRKLDYYRSVHLGHYGFPVYGDDDWRALLKYLIGKIERPNTPAGLEEEGVQQFDAASFKEMFPDQADRVADANQILMVSGPITFYRPGTLAAGLEAVVAAQKQELPPGLRIDQLPIPASQTEIRPLAVWVWDPMLGAKPYQPSVPSVELQLGQPFPYTALQLVNIAILGRLDAATVVVRAQWSFEYQGRQVQVFAILA